MEHKTPAPAAEIGIDSDTLHRRHKATLACKDGKQRRGARSESLPLFIFDPTNWHTMCGKRGFVSWQVEVIAGLAGVDLIPVSVTAINLLGTFFSMHRLIVHTGAIGRNLPSLLEASSRRDRLEPSHRDEEQERVNYGR